jgi:hypothetical protein
MNVYFLVEGKSTEKKLYPSWLSSLIPQLKRVQFYDDARDNNYYILSASGYPGIISDSLKLALQHMNEVQNYQRFVVCLDSDEQSIKEREEAVRKSILEKIEETKSFKKIELDIIVQNRCIETWLLGNKKIFNSRQPASPPLQDYKLYYDVSNFDPELMGMFNCKNHATFHLEYLQEIFRAKGLTYTKRYPQDAQKTYYLEQLVARVEDNKSHLKSFKKFLLLCQKIRLELEQRES